MSPGDPHDRLNPVAAAVVSAPYSGRRSRVNHCYYWTSLLDINKSNTLRENRRTYADKYSQPARVAINVTLRMFRAGGHHETFAMPSLYLRFAPQMCNLITPTGNPFGFELPPAFDNTIEKTDSVLACDRSRKARSGNATSSWFRLHQARHNRSCKNAGLYPTVAQYRRVKFK